MKLGSTTFLVARTKLPSHYASLSSNSFSLLLHLLPLLASLCSLIELYACGEGPTVPGSQVANISGKERFRAH